MPRGFPKFERFFRAYGFRDIHLIRACGVAALGEVAMRSDVLAKAEELADKL